MGSRTHHIGRSILIAAALTASLGSGAATRDLTAHPAETAAAERARESSLVVRVTSRGCGGIAFGSGVVVPGGRVLTNRHVVAGAANVEVRRSDGVRIGARIERVGRDVDLAVLWAGPAVGPGAAPGGRLEPHQTVTVLGHPGGGPAVRSAGPVTARARLDGRGLPGDAGAWVDAAVAEGSSGGPVFRAEAGLRGPNAGDGLSGPNAGDGLRGPNAGDGLRGPNAGARLVGVVFALEHRTGLAGVIDGDVAARFLAGDLPVDPAAGCEPDPADR
jgi:putative serine protease PepD